GEGGGGRAGDQDRRRPREGGRLLVSAEPAQSCDPSCAPAGLRHQATEYLAALGKGLQPNTLISDNPITLPPIAGGRDYWTPKNYDRSSRGTLTLRQALENSRNLATVHLLDGGIESKPEASLNRLCDLAVEAQIYRECLRYYPFV